MEGEKEKQKEIEKYIEGIKRLQDTGVRVLVEGRNPGRREWDKVMSVREDGAFYMCDYIKDECGKLQEIHFDLVRHDNGSFRYRTPGRYHSQDRPNYRSGYRKTL